MRLDFPPCVSDLVADFVSNFASPWHKHSDSIGNLFSRHHCQDVIELPFVFLELFQLAVQLDLGAVPRDLEHVR
jgi:hypothetical protein